MSNRTNINFRRKNLPFDEEPDTSIDETEKTYDYSDFKFTKRNSQAHRDFQKKAQNLNQMDLDNNRIRKKRSSKDSMPFFPPPNNNQYQNNTSSRYSYSEYDNEGGNNYQQKTSSGGSGGRRNSHKFIKNNKSPNQQGGSRRNPKLKKIIFRLLLIIILFVLMFLGYLFYLKNTSAPLSFVMIGVDQREGQSDKEIRADAIMEVTVSMKKDEVIMASIPRDTYTYLACTGQQDKITHAYIYGAINWEDKGGGKACTTKAVSDLTGLATDKYMKINFADTVHIVNAIGGIDLTATSTFSEQNSKGEKNVYFFEKGKKYHMDGEQALAYARHRKTDNDIERGLRQQEVFRRMFSAIKKKGFWEWPTLFIRLSSMIDTNLSMNELIKVGYSFIYDKDIEQFKFDWSGVNYNGISYVELSPLSIESYRSKVAELEK